MESFNHNLHSHNKFATDSQALKAMRLFSIFSRCRCLSTNAGSEENGDSDKILPSLLTKFTQLEGPQKFCEFGKNGEVGESGIL